MHPQFGIIPVSCFYLDLVVTSPVDKWMISWWFSRFEASITSVMKKFCTMWHSFLTPTQPATIPSPIKETTCPPFPPKDRIPSPFPWPVVFSWAPFNYLFKRDTKERHRSPQTLSVFSLLLNKPSVFHPISSSLISSVNLRQHCPIPPSLTLSSPPRLQIRVCRCVFAVRETSVSTVNHLYCSIAISLALWCSLGMSNGTKKTHKPHNYRPEKWGESETACLSS